MGSCYALLSEKESSTVNHQYALRYALELDSRECQMVALGNLGFSPGMYDNDLDKQRSLVEKYMQLSTEVIQRTLAGPLEKLGNLAARSGDFETGRQYFQEALDVARESGDKDKERCARVKIGIASGETKFDAHMSGVIRKNGKLST